MDGLLRLAPMFGCAIGMLLCMFLMGRMGHGKTDAKASDPEVAELRAEVAALRAERQRETSSG